jgi:hypothetical protein
MASVNLAWSYGLEIVFQDYLDLRRRTKTLYNSAGQ